MQLKTPLAYAVAALCFASPFGTFETDTAISEAQKPGSVEFNSSTGEYAVTGSGGDIGGRADSFHYIWKKVSSDAVLNADARFIGAGVSGQGKAALMIRQSLDPRSSYAAAVLQADGAATMQYRPDTGAESRTEQVMSGTADVTSPVHLYLARSGDGFTVRIGRMGKIGGPLPTRPPITVTMNGPVYVGLAVASHDPAARETAVFSNVFIQ